MVMRQILAILTDTLCVCESKERGRKRGRERVGGREGKMNER